MWTSFLAIPSRTFKIPENDTNDLEESFFSI